MSVRSFRDPGGGPAIGRDRHGACLPDMEDAAIEVLETVPEWIWDGLLPVPVERIATDHFGLLIRESADPASVPGAPSPAVGAYLSGMLLPERGEIWVNSNDTLRWPPRRRFTIAHELGHWRLHRDSSGHVLCRAAELSGGRVAVEAGAGTSSPPVRKKQRPVLPLPEAEANAFAAALLMPAFHLRTEHARCEGSLETLKARFDSSADAMRRRLRTLGLSFVEPPEPNGSVV